jgi:hypothetical protein
MILTPSHLTIRCLWNYPKRVFSPFLSYARNKKQETRLFDFAIVVSFCFFVLTFFLCAGFEFAWF